MIFSKLIESKNNNKLNPNAICETLYKGACVKIKNSHKTFQVVGINLKSEVCWIREWPFSLDENKTFTLQISQITIQTFCSNSFIEE